MKLELRLIRRDGGTQPREAIQDTICQEYAQDMKRGDVFPPVTVFYDGSEYWLAHGFHRFAAVDFLGEKEIDCDVVQGTLADAQWFSYSANRDNGQRRTNEDKQRAVKAALLHPKGAALADCEIARHVGVTSQMVMSWRERLNLSCKDYKIASASGDLPKPELEPQHRTATRKGKTYKINVAAIGKRRPKVADGDTTPSNGTPRAVHPQTQKRLTVTELILNFMGQARHFSELIEWLETSNRHEEAVSQLELAIQFLTPLIGNLDREAIAIDPANRSRLHIQEVLCQ